MRHRVVIYAQIVESQCAGKSAGIPDFKAISKEPDFDRGMAVIIAMGNGVDNGLTNCIGRKFVSGGGNIAFRAGTHSTVDFGQHKVAGLISLFKKVSGVNLLGAKRTAIASTVTMDAFCLGGTVKPLGGRTEKKDSRVRGVAVFKQI